MTRTLSTVPAAPPRWRSIAATLALVGALVATTAAAPATADVVGDGPGTISGTVSTSEGQPVEGIWVNVSISVGEGTSFSAGTSTDATGHYELSGLPVGSYGIHASVFGYQQPEWQEAVLTEESPTATADFVLWPFVIGVGTISGHVTADGAPLADMYVSAYSPSSGQSLDTFTDVNGYYQFTELGTGSWSVSVFAGEQYQPLWQPAVEITDSAPTATLDFPFLSWPVGTAAINGVLTDSATGAPLPWASISAFSEDAPYNSSTMSDESGAFSFELLPAGTYHLSFSSWGYLNASQEINLQPDQTVNASRALIAMNSSISGHVEDTDGNPIAGVFLNAYSADGNSGWTMTDENGDYVMSDLGAVEYTVNLGGPGTAYDQQERIVAAEANADVRADFTLVNRTTGSITGYLLGLNGEWYSEPICATLYSAHSMKPLAQVVTIGEEFGDGSYSFYDLAPGAYTVGFRDCDDDPGTKFDKVFLGDAKNFSEATFVTIAAGEDSHENVVTLTPRGNQ